MKGGEKMQNSADISEKALYAEYSSVYYYALTLCRDENMAQDITQETFLKAMNAFDKFKGSSSLYTWLCTIAKNIWLNKCKSQNREICIDEIENTLTSNEKTIEHTLDDKEIARAIHIILHSMKEPYKEVFTLRTFGELPFSDIAELFSKTESWARVTYHRAKKMITETLRKDGYIDE